jgi:hypothetical protein
MVEAALCQQPVDEGMIDDAAIDEFGRRRHVFAESAAQIVEDGDLVPSRDERVSHVRADEPGSAGD